MNWNNNYDKLMNYLYKNSDNNYKNFHKKLLNDDNIEVIGVRMPVLKKIAKYIAKNDYKGFIKYNKHKTYEENTIHGLILGYIKVPLDELFKEIDFFLKFNNNWATNDATCANLKAFKNIDIDKVIRYINSKDPFTIRFGLVLLLDYYTQSNVDKILEICDNIRSEEYYVKMANAWLISICYIKAPTKTFKFLEACHLDEFTFNKSISKICDSYRVSKEEKEELKHLKTKRRN